MNTSQGLAGVSAARAEYSYAAGTGGELKIPINISAPIAREPSDSELDSDALRIAAKAYREIAKIPERQKVEEFV